MSCDSKNPLVRDGTNQNQRLPDALRPENVQLDDRTLADMINYVRKYAAEIQFYNTANEADGSWEEFFSNDIACMIAVIADIDLEDIEITFDDLNDTIEGTSPEATKKQNFKTQYDLIFTLSYELNRWYEKAIEDYKLREELYRLITSELRFHLKDAISFYLEAQNTPELLDKNFFDASLSEYPVKPSEQMLGIDFDSIWIVWDGPENTKPATWQAYYATITAQDYIYGSDRSNVSDSIVAAQDSINQIAKTYYSAVAQLVNQSGEMLDEILEDYPYHEPHMSLFLAFIQLFQHAQDHYNTLTKSHLDFYLSDVLQLEKKDAVPDQVHILLKLAKNVTTNKVAAGTALKAGKDATGVELNYETTEEIVVNEAAVKSLQSVYIDQNNDYKIYYASKSNSADGIGEEFEEEGTSWKAFGESQEDIDEDDQTMAEAEVGFAVSSKALFMAEGRRFFGIAITTDKTFNTEADGELYKQSISIHLTTEDGWHKITLQKTGELVEPGETVETDFDTLYFEENKIYARIKIAETDPPIVAYDKDVHGGNYDIKTPLAKFVLEDGPNTYAYETLKGTKITNVVIGSTVFGVRNLVLQDDNAVLDPSAPFMPFGPSPVKGSRFLVGSKEIFQKHVTALALKGKWVDLPANMQTNYALYGQSPALNGDEFMVKANVLEEGSWGIAVNTDIKLFSGTGASVSENFAVLLHSQEQNQPLETIAGNNIDVEELEPYEVTTRNGFVRLELTGPSIAFGHSIYPTIYANATMAQVAAASRPGGSFSTSAIPKEPYTPVLKDFYVEYSAVHQIDLSLSTKEAYDENQGQFFHMYPLGHTEPHPYLTKEEVTLLPQFKDGTNNSNGEFYIGLENVDAPQNVSILIQVAEGSEDPELPTQEVNWYYLVDDEWTAFETSEILSDNTNGLLKSGIIKFSVPKEITKGNNMLDGDYYWIKAAVDANTDAVCEIIDVHAQAVVAEFEDNKNDPNHLSKALAAETISKLKSRDADITKVTQPYASFSGKMEESDDAYYTRTAERLRHKQRAISIWDYERIVLEEYPEIFKVKCINHTTYGYQEHLMQNIDSEFAPGYVSLILIPDLKNQNVVDPYRPRVSKADLEDIGDFLKTIVSPFVAEKIKVINPLYEQIQVEFEVEFISGVDRGYYEKQLNKDIKKYLAPWAFDEGEDIVIGGKVRSSSILNYIEELSYVDYVKNFQMHHYVDDVLEEKDVEEITPTTARSVFTSISKTDETQEHQVKEIAE